MTRTANLTLEFGGGINSRSSERSLNPQECSSGQNFVLDIDRRSLLPRPAFDQAGTAPNGGQINGFAQLYKADGTVSTLIQAGTNVYSWDGDSTWAVVGTVSSAARLRGHLWQNDQLAGKVLITDLALQERVKTWNGTSFANAAFNLSNEFRARYCFVLNDRAWFANVLSNGTATPHLIVASEIEDFTTLSVSNRPSSSLGEADPFYLTAPDLRYINGIAGQFGRVTFSTRQGSIFALEGASAKDFSVVPFYQGSGAAGDEALIVMGGDVVYGAAGRIENASANGNTVGYVQADDLSRPIFPDVAEYNDWTAAYNSRLERGYFFPADEPEVWVYHKPLARAGVSAWSKFVTDHPVSFQPTCVWSMYDPLDGLEKVFFGDSSGNIYRMEGSGSLDGGTHEISVSRTSPMIEAPNDGQVLNIRGYVQYRRLSAANLTLEALWNGDMPMTNSASLELTEATGGYYFGGSSYFGGGAYFGQPFSGRLVRKKYDIGGQGDQLQIKVTVTGEGAFEIDKIAVNVQAG